jgi:hypothetical protein
MIIIFPTTMFSPSTRKRLLQTKSAGSGCFVVSLQARNKVSKPSTEMELVRWPHAKRSTCEQDRCVCVILHISSWRYGRIVTLFWCINDDYNMCVCVWFCISRDILVWLSLCSTIFCMIYLLTCKHEEEQADRGWLICVSFDVICVCVWFCISRDMLVWFSLCSTIFFMIYLLTCKAWRTSRRGLANPCLFWCNMFLISHIFPITKVTRVR